MSKISAAQSQSKDEGNRSTMQATINLLLSDTYSIVMVGTEPKRKPNTVMLYYVIILICIDRVNTN